jgi:hypothetical protein
VIILSKKVLVYGSWDSYYGTGISSYSIIDEETWAELQAVCDKEFSFWVHEWAGKHSENNIEVSELGFYVVTSDQTKIAVIEDIFGTHVGNIDLVEYVMERYEEYYYEEEEKEDE